MTEAVELDLMSFPLQGQQLIEASAGTGKTFTIAALYLRLLLGQGRAEGPLAPDQILVVTFTEAATEELRDRVRKRIATAREAFLLGSSPDPLLQALLEQQESAEQAVVLLEDALRQMDEAAIFTIHGFCQRMLRQHAFESGSLFNTELVKDSKPLLRQAVLDFWRELIYPLPDVAAELVLQQWSGPDAFLAELRGYLGRHGLRLQPEMADQNLERHIQQRLELVGEFKQRWLAEQDQMAELITASGVSKQRYNKANLPKWLEKISLFATSAQPEPDNKLNEVLAKFTPAGLAEKARGELPEHPLFEFCQRLLEETVPVREIVLSRGLKQVEHRLQRQKQQSQQQTFDDLLTRLHHALESPGGAMLASAIRRQFPVAMIDEFQDTDPLQYGIFSMLYGQRLDSALVMIGDPKQAIYGFRGADIFTYIQARKTVEQPYTLPVNWRSSAAMVEAVNLLFKHHASPFIYDEDIPFQPVRAQGKSERLCLAGEAQPALHLWHYVADKPLTKTDYKTHFARATAGQIYALLSGDSQIGERPIHGGDIAVLVKDRFEADAVRQALQQFDIRSVYLSNKETVFHTPEAADLALILGAAENPQDESSLRAALASGLMLLSIEALDRLNRDEQAWEAALAEFAEYHQIWQRQGVLPMLKQLLRRRDIAAGMLAQPQGERRLTNLLQLAELLQQASSRLDSPAALLRWFDSQQREADTEADEQILRLESEQQLVTVITVHKSKGLEFPIVFLPFPCMTKKAQHALYHDPEGQTVLDLADNESGLQQADQERLAEDLRLLYVALTRSVYACFLGVAEIKAGKNSPPTSASGLGYLLAGQAEDLASSLAVLAQQSDAIQVTPPPDHALQQDLFSSDAESRILRAREFTTGIARQWRVTSYSALSRHSQALPELPGLDLEVADEYDPHAVTEAAVQPGRSIFSFPRGATAGTCLHALFEQISFSGYTPAEQREPLLQQLQLAGYDEDWLPVVEQLVLDTLHCDLDGNGLLLSQVEDHDRQVEMEFMFPVAGVCADQLDNLLREHDPLSARAAGRLEFEPVEGMLKGYIDLLFRKDGRYYVVDYKSNHLGDHADCYSQDRLAEAMLGHRYDLQYQLYSLALHRLLRSRLPDYRYERHFGGVYYLFLRGLKPGQTTGIFATRPSEPLLMSLDALFSSGGLQQ